jgi:hypothetical protein
MMKRVFSIVAGAMFLSAAVASAQSTPAASDMQGHHSMEGKVTKVDAKKGWIDVKTQEGSMKLHFPPSALEGVKKGDAVTVDLGIKDNGPSASPKTSMGKSKDTTTKETPSTKY